MDESDADSEDDEDELDEVEESEDADDFVGSQLPAGQLARNPYPELAKDGCWRLSQYLTDNELERHSHLGPFPRESFYKTCQQILLSTHRSLRDGILSGNLQKAIADSPRELNDIIDGLAFRASQGQPGHYLFEYVNPSTGLAPTPQQIEAILGYAERYLASAPADHALVEKIDCWKR